ncbi:helix-turn-helix domain-containing protein [Celerinatantimonas diazotrophica]|uniref:AraC-like protein n=1 Tax=Celerinatantimonas diazotrophica TaxID=412034 RepID=A0A4R1JAB0_9GAMM|nr:AraC family transcriptional regulator [Celerinatantimonas diazotrophica]TCK47576.1 AraC-like protein [Celerinatantimonas diazotrophica]CAG9296801.1 HTH-type transcriptional activator RhaR [Celerinatantimonas diazotrophica]
MANIYIEHPLEIENGGLFISNGRGIHPKRVIKSYELIFVLHGTLAIREGTHDYLLRSGDALILHPKIEHQGIVNFPSDLKFYWVHFRLHSLRHQRNVDTTIDLNKIGQVNDVTKITELFNLMLREQELGVDKMTLNLLLLVILREISLKMDANQLSKPKELAYRARSVIRRFYNEPLTPSQIAQTLKCNVDYLGRIYKQTFACSLGEAIQLQKISAAKHQLVEQGLTIAEIADELSYHDTGYFRRVFVKHVGMSPSRYRKLYSIARINSN